MKQNGEEPRQTDNGRDKASRRTQQKGQGGAGDLADRGYPKTRNSWRGPGRLRLAESSVVSVWMVLPEPCEDLLGFATCLTLFSTTTRFV